MYKITNLIALVTITVLAGCVPDINDPIARCHEMGEPAGTQAFNTCVSRVNGLISAEMKYRDSFCYSVDDRIFCKKNPLHPDNTSLNLNDTDADFLAFW